MHIYTKIGLKVVNIKVNNVAVAGKKMVLDYGLLLVDNIGDGEFDVLILESEVPHETGNEMFCVLIVLSFDSRTKQTRLVKKK